MGSYAAYKSPQSAYKGTYTLERMFLRGLALRAPRIQIQALMRSSRVHDHTVVLGWFATTFGPLRWPEVIKPNSSNPAKSDPINIWPSVSVLDWRAVRSRSMSEKFLKNSPGLELYHKPILHTCLHSNIH